MLLQSGIALELFIYDAKKYAIEDEQIVFIFCRFDPANIVNCIIPAYACVHI